MRKILFIIVSIFIAFLLEFVLFNWIGHLFKPNLLLLSVIFLTLCFGIRYGLFTAALAGTIRDSFGANLFGMSLFSYVLCSYLTIFLRKKVYSGHTNFSRILLALMITASDIIIQFCLRLYSTELMDAFLAVKFIFIPEVLATLLVTPFVFQQLRTCVLKLFA